MASSKPIASSAPAAAALLFLAAALVLTPSVRALEAVGSSSAAPPPPTPAPAPAPPPTTPPVVDEPTPAPAPPTPAPAPAPSPSQNPCPAGFPNLVAYTEGIVTYLGRGVLLVLSPVPVTHPGTSSTKCVCYLSKTITIRVPFLPPIVKPDASGPLTCVRA